MAKSYESIMGAFTKTVDKLNKRRDELVSRMKERTDAIVRLASDNKIDDAEAIKCAATATKIAKLME